MDVFHTVVQSKRNAQMHAQAVPGPSTTYDFTVHEILDRGDTAAEQWAFTIEVSVNGKRRGGCEVHPDAAVPIQMPKPLQFRVGQKLKIVVWGVKQEPATRGTGTQKFFGQVTISALPIGHAAILPLYTEKTETKTEQKKDCYIRLSCEEHSRFTMEGMNLTGGWVAEGIHYDDGVKHTDFLLREGDLDPTIMSGRGVGKERSTFAMAGHLLGDELTLTQTFTGSKGTQTAVIWYATVGEDGISLLDGSWTTPDGTALGTFTAHKDKAVIARDKSPGVQERLFSTADVPPSDALWGHLENVRLIFNKYTYSRKHRDGTVSSNAVVHVAMVLLQVEHTEAQKERFLDWFRRLKWVPRRVTFQDFWEQVVLKYYKYLSDEEKPLVVRNLEQLFATQKWIETWVLWRYIALQPMQYVFANSECLGKFQGQIFEDDIIEVTSIKYNAKGDKMLLFQYVEKKKGAKKIHNQQPQVSGRNHKLHVMLRYHAVRDTPLRLAADPDGKKAQRPMLAGETTSAFAADVDGNVVKTTDPGTNKLLWMDIKDEDGELQLQYDPCDYWMAAHGKNGKVFCRKSEDYADLFGKKPTEAGAMTIGYHISGN
jgi:hypothetical protein